MTKTKKTTAVSRFFASIKRGNAAFAKMTKARKRVAIARDVIKALDAKAIVGEHGTYLASYRKTGEHAWYDQISLKAEDNPSASTQDLLPVIPACHVCAKGALFVCTVGRRNQVTAKQAREQNWYGDSLSKSLGGIFSGSQLDLIESYFENGMRSGRTDMKAVMENIIKNKGTFKPTEDLS